MKTWLSFLLSVALSAAALQGEIYHWTTIAGNAGWGFADGTNSDGHFSVPVGIAADQNGNLFVADSHVRKSVTIDWTLRESAQAQIRVLVRRILRK